MAGIFRRNARNFDSCGKKPSVHRASAAQALGASKHRPTLDGRGGQTKNEM